MRAAIRILSAIGAANGLLAGLSFGLAAGAPQLRAGLSLDERSLGLLLAAMPAGLMLGTYAWGVLADVIGERRTLVLAWSAVAAACLGSAAVASHVWNAHPTTGMLILLGALLLVAGAGGSAAHSAGGRAITQAFPLHMHGRVLSIRHTFIPIGGAIGGAGVPWTLHHRSLAELLVASALASLLVTVALARALPSAARERAIEAAARDSNVRGAIDAASDGEIVPMRDVSPLRSTNLWLLAGSGSLFALVQLGLMSFLTINLIDEAGMSAAAAATIFAIAQLLGAAGRIGLGDLADRIDDPLLVLMSLALVGIAIDVAALLTPVRIEGLLLALLLVVFTTWNGVSVAAAARLSPPGRMGATLGMQTTMNATMGVVAPVGVGAMLATSGWSMVELTAIAALTIALAGLATLNRRSPGKLPT